MSRNKKDGYRYKEQFNSSDQVDGMGDQIEDFRATTNVQLTGSPKGINFIKKDETNREAVRKLFNGRKMIAVEEYW